ncbi:hypothetical protein IFM89_010279 [Coptis chinensis]|uniref:Bromo domain-containing protein n=1 Tax=Coptis chinensis TaxID=261450 RepID=A0A835H3G9_9MAGN|nr:hypothetical protein IFM89_010279 [Coptis chinensis]
MPLVRFCSSLILLTMLLQELQRVDNENPLGNNGKTREIFVVPVDPIEVEGYYEIIKEPMNFMTMEEKIEQGAYKSLDQFERKPLAPNLLCMNDGRLMIQGDPAAVCGSWNLTTDANKPDAQVLHAKLASQVGRRLCKQSNVEIHGVKDAQENSNSNGV